MSFNPLQQMMRLPPAVRCVRAAGGSLLLFLTCSLLVGCAGGAANPEYITEMPGSWEAYENQNVKLEGNAANSPSGPFIRLGNSGRLLITGFRGWPIDFVGRPVGVEGRVVKGTDGFADRFVLQLERYYRVRTDQVPVSIAPPEPEQPSLPQTRKKTEKKKK